MAVPTGSLLHWPCPHGCLNWCRTDGSMTNHHPRCEYVDESLIDVWKVRIPGEEHGCICDREEDARKMAIEDADAPLEVVPMKMHREIFDNLEDFGGF